MAKTAEYTRKAIEKYRNQYDFINLRFPKGTKERLELLGITNSDLVDTCLQFIDGIEETVENETQNLSEAEEQGKAVELVKKPQKDNRQTLEEIQAIIDKKKAEEEEQRRKKEDQKAKEKQAQVDELQDYVRKMKEDAEKERKERHEGYSKIPDEAFIKALREDDVIRKDLERTREEEAVKNNRISEFGEDNYNRFMKCLEVVEKEEKEQKRAETIAAAKFAEKGKDI